MMDQYGVRRPIWLTETAYSADDEPWITPADVYFPSPAYLASERMQAEYEVRYNTILLANGVEKIFYHAGTGSGINHNNLWTMFLRYQSEPYKAYASQAVQAKLLTPREVRQASLARPAALGLCVSRCRAVRGRGLGPRGGETKASPACRHEAATLGHDGTTPIRGRSRRARARCTSLARASRPRSWNGRWDWFQTISKPVHRPPVSRHRAPQCR